MKSSSLLLSLILLLMSICGTTHAQLKKPSSILLHTGRTARMQTVNEAVVVSVNRSLQAHQQEPMLAIFQFEHILSSQEKDQLAAQGIRVVDYLSSKAYIVLLSKPLSLSNMRVSEISQVAELTADLKLAPELTENQAPVHAIVKKGMVDVWLYLVEGTMESLFQEKLKAMGVELLEGQLDFQRMHAVRVKQTEIMTLAGLPEVLYVQPIPGEKQPNGVNSLSNSRANLLKSPLGLSLDGSGVVVGVGDNANLNQHIDLKGRFINHNERTGDWHGLFVSGIVAGGGIANEIGEGYAPGATIVSQYFSKIIANTSTYVKDYGMAITNNSYGPDVNNCGNFGTYDIQSAYADYQAFQFPHLQHVFAAGNSGTSSCPGLPTGYGNVASTFQVSKNVLTVGNTTYQGAIASMSSRGPSRDGRIKPEIVAQGTTVISIMPDDAYASSGGTSFASPAVAGGLALMYQHYRTDNGGLNPKNGLMKALICNGATDLGNPGPDFQYGFGWLNLDRSVAMLDADQHANDSIPNGGSKDVVINIPAGTAQAKIMLYWNDRYANPLAASSLVNDLDLSVIGPGIGNTTLPLVLSTDRAQADAVAAPGEDHVNNIEQVVLNSPSAGSYTIHVYGNAVVTPLQEFFVVYDLLPQSFKLTYPIGGEHIAPGDVMNISWNVFGTSGTFDVSYSADNGGSWTNIATGLAATARQTDWTVPAIYAKQVLVKVRDNTSAVEHISSPFIVLARPAVTLSPVQCEGYIAVEWATITGATDYEILVLEGRELISKGTTASLSYVLSGLSPDSTYYVAVRARITGTPGRRGLAVKRQPNTGTCSGTISDGDLRIIAFTTPMTSGRVFTLTALSATQQIKVNVKNLDDAATGTPFDLHCQVNSGSVQTLTGNNIATGGAVNEFTFITPYDFSAVGTYTVKVWITSSADLVPDNNELTVAFRQLPNEPVALPFLDNFDALTIASQNGTAMGVLGTTRYDFKSSEVSGRIRNFVSSNMAFSQPRAITLDNSQYQASGAVNEWIGTYNMDGRTYADDIRLDFAHKNHGAEVFSENKVWIRGDDDDPWIEAYDLGSNQPSAQNGYKMVRSLEVTRLLFDNAQLFSKSFQIRWGVKAKFITADQSSADGYSFDNVSLYTVTNDVQLAGITAPDSTACSLGLETVRVIAYNSSDAILSNVPIKLKVDALSEITESIPTIPAHGQVTYTFTAQADLSAPGAHIVKATVALGTDSYSENNVSTLSYFNAPVISAFPYLQDFESENGSWHAEGKNSSWQYGTPASAKIDHAASGTKAWKTNLTGTYNSDETSYLYSPCFMIGGMTNPTISFSLALDLESCDEPCDRVVVEYSENGTVWQKLGTMGTGVNWYNKSYSDDDVWSIQDYNRWHVATASLPTSLTSIRFRFVMKSDPFVVFDGIAIDDIHVYDKPNGIYNTAANSSIVTQNINAGPGVTHFMDGGKLIATIDPMGQALGSTDVQAFIHTGSVRNASDSYYLNRNITIKPTTVAPSNPVKIRLYFLDSESEALLNATGCSTCPLPESAYEMNVSQYTNTNKSVEDGNLANNSAGSWLYHDGVRKVPFDQGYYIDFEVENFSEFWFASGDLTNTNPLPVKLTWFIAKKEEANSRIEWATTEETNASHFEIQVAVGDNGLRDGKFRTLGSQQVRNAEEDKTYSFLDTEAEKSGTRYYRLKMVDLDGTFTYSKIQQVHFSDQEEWVLYPNPSSGNFYVVAQASTGEKVSVLVRDILGRVVSETSYKASGHLEKFRINTVNQPISPGIYNVEVVTDLKKQNFKIVHK